MGTLVVRRNGFLRPPGDLDDLAQATSLLARRLREVCVCLAERRPFDARLPEPVASDARDLPAGFQPGESWRTRAVEVAERYGLALENPFAYHRAFPSVPVPGMAYVVLHGDIPHVGKGRLAIHRERDAARPAVVISAPPGAGPPQPGGVAYRQQGARLEVADALLAVWGTTSWSGYALLDHIDEFCNAAASVLGS